MVVDFCRATDERLLLKFCISDQDMYYSVASKLVEDDFLNKSHRTLYVLIGSLYGSGYNKLDSTIIINEAKNMGVIDSLGGPEYLSGVVNADVSTSNFDKILHNVLEASTKSKLYEAIDRHRGTIIDSVKGRTSLSSADLIGNLENFIMDLSTSSRAIKEPLDVAEGLSEWIDNLRDNKVEMSGISTGYPILDKQIDGMIPGTLMFIAARKKMGKSAFLTNVAAYVAFKLKIPTLYVDTEMSFLQFRSRLVAGMAGVKERTIIHGGYSDNEYNNIVRRCLRLATEGNLYHEYMPGYTVDKLVALYKKFKLKHDIGFAVFDYLKEPALSATSDKQRKEYQILGDVATRLKDLSGELDIPFLSAVQLNRSDDIADSDKIARYADIIAHWAKKELEEFEAGGHQGGTHKLMIKDTRRGGSTGEAGISYYFFKEHLRIKEVDAEHQLVNYMKEDEVVNDDSADTTFSDEELL